MIDSLFTGNNYQMSKAMLDVTSMRHDALAANLANVETPGYKRVDVAKSFSDELKAHFEAGKVDSPMMHQRAIEQDPSARSTRADGNNVEIDSELTKMSSNEMQYEVLTEFVSSSLAQLKAAITGRSGS